MLPDTMRALAGRRVRDEDGIERTLELLPAATESEIRSVEQRLPCRFPDDVRAALMVTKGLANGPLESFSLIDLEGFGLEELLPYAYSIAHDGYGNYWVLDLLPDIASWAPVFYVCHDPPVLAYQSASLEEFVLAMVMMEQEGAASPLNIVHDELVHQIWRSNPGLLPASAAAGGSDPDVQAFAGAIPAAAFIADLRHPKLGDGFSWGRFGPRTIIRRAPQKRIWVVEPPAKRRGLLGGFFARKQ